MLILISLLLSPAVPVAGQTDTAAGASAEWVIHYDGDPRLVEVTDSVLSQTKRQLKSFLQSDLDFQFDFFIATTEKQFDSLGYFKLPEWGVGAAIPELDRIVIKAPSLLRTNPNAVLSFEQTAAHEYAHLALDHRLHGIRPPRWFNEGLAMLVSAEWSWQRTFGLSASLLFGNYIPLEEIERVNRFDQSMAALAYNQSYLAVQYLYKEYGSDQVQLFLDSLAQKSTVDNALIGSVGSDYGNFDQEFHLYLKSRFNLITLAGETVYFWLAMALILIIGAVLAIRRKKAYYRKWEEAEKYASTDFDYGDPENPEQTDDDEPWRH